jgi:hypothetical protein
MRHDARRTVLPVPDAPADDVLTPEQALRNQTAAGIKTSLVYPVVVQGNAIGALIFGLIVATTPCCSSHV